MLLRHFEEGGSGMYPVTFILAVVIAIACQRVFVLWTTGRAAAAGRLVVHELQGAGTVESALGVVATLPGAMSRIVAAGLREAGRPGHDVAGAMDVARAAEVARLERGLGTLALLAKVAFLAGLLGTIVGLVPAHGGFGHSDAASKATMLAKGISEAINCNALGLLTASLAYATHALLARAVASRAELFAAEIARFRIELGVLQPFVRLAGRPAPHTLQTYRGPSPIAPVVR